MAFLKDHTYKFCFNVAGKLLTFTGKIVEDSEHFITFLDKFDVELTYNKNNLVSSEEIQDE